MPPTPPLRRPLLEGRSSIFDFAAKCRREIARDVIRWPEWKITHDTLMNPSTIESILDERAKFLKTKKGKRMLALAAELEELLKP